MQNYVLEFVYSIHPQKYSTHIYYHFTLYLVKVSTREEKNAKETYNSLALMYIGISVWKPSALFIKTRKTFNKNIYTYESYTRIRSTCSRVTYVCRYAYIFGIWHIYWKLFTDENMLPLRRKKYKIKIVQTKKFFVEWRL